MTRTDTIEGTLEREDTHTNSELKLAEVQAEMDRQDEQVATPAELAAMERHLKAGIAGFRAELDAIRGSRILDVRMPDSPHRRRELLAPLAKPNPYRQLAPDKLEAEHEEAQRRWVPTVPEGAGPATQVATSAPTSNDTAPELEPVRQRWWRRVFDEIFPFKPDEPRKEGGA